MATITVTTGAEDSNEGDDVISLREALEIAEQAPGEDTIVFADNVNTVTLDFNLSVEDGSSVIIEGDRNGDGAADVTIDADNNGSHFFIGNDSDLTLDGLRLINGFRQGFTPSFSSSNGGNAVGSIDNSGNLTLIRTVLDDNTALGGNGARGSNGAFGGNGRNGADAGGLGERGGNGTDGGNGTSATAGGDGGFAVAGIYNRAGATLTLMDSAFGDGQSARGGTGAAGGNAGEGMAAMVVAAVTEAIQEM